ncbi:50S ribosomal protein L29 [Metamycoplasma phocicerebrale]|uniref:Large ribosomal subunit protein uL29 n=1 Tax=Metamycoplasma phocicerebrale TaxID=142649 RepID=A0A3T0TU19_9BACT|nr:50S ribosomal protein L29 [Metamycoplasma phocicerebrale]AZZ65585.1 50S ribosomal protein L29 [Metamycoplasma phocicerebrale]
MTYAELSKKSVEELNKMLADLKAELFSLRFKNATRQLDQTHKINLVKKDIARALTALNVKKQEGDK